MAKDKISQYSTTNALNTDIGGIDIDENCLPSNLNNGIREVMVQLKEFQDGTSGDSLTITGTATLNGTTIPASKTLVDTDSVQTLTNKTLTSPVVNTPNLTGGTINNATIGASTPSTVASTNLSYTGTLTGGTGVINIGSGQVYKDASGNVGIGTSFPISKLNVVSATNGGISIAQGTENFYGASAHRFFTDGYASEVVHINTSGNVGIGTSNPIDTLQVNGGVTIGSDTFTTARSRIFESFGLNIESGAAGSGRAIIFGTNNTERARITAGGNLLVGATATGLFFDGKLNVLGNSSFKTESGSGAYPVFLWNNATSGNNSFALFLTETSATQRGSITFNRGAGLVAYNTTSDRRAKDIIGEVTDSGNVIDQLKVYNGLMKGANVARPMLIADEAQEVTPYAVTGEKNAVDADAKPIFQQMDVSSYVPLLIAELQSLRKRVAELELQINSGV